MEISDMIHKNAQKGLYNPRYEHDACGIGAIANIKGVKSHKLIKDALLILKNLEHRGGAEDNSGDGAGILFQVPHKFFAKQDLGFTLPNEGDYAIGQIFVSQNENAKKSAISTIKNVLANSGLELLGFRDVPINPKVIGIRAFNSMPSIKQVFIKKPDNLARGLDFERKLYITRRSIEKESKDISKFYICSLSSRTIVYKGMLVSTQVSDFYLDLQDLDLQSAIALVHSRFSTNTFPSWQRAHPNRYMVHNGEINTINGNINAMSARAGNITSSVIDLEAVFPIISEYSSDSAMFDNTLEFLVMNGKSLPEAIMLMIPEPWTQNKDMNRVKRDFYEYYSTMMEPWDGPASIIFSDGVVMGASLDRNGFRPSRYYITKDDFLILSSETGALKIEESRVLYKNRLRPGRLLLVDTQKGQVIEDNEVKMQVASSRPYSKWVKNILDLDLLQDDDLDTSDTKTKNKKYKHTFLDKSNLAKLQRAFGYSYDEINLNIEYMSVNAKEIIASMGSDTPIALLSSTPRSLFDYFKQVFAQVTNPPLDAIREKIVTSQRIYLGAEGDILNPNQNSAKRLRLNRVLLTNEELFKIKNIQNKGFKTKEISLLFDKNRIYTQSCGEFEVLEIVLQNIFKEIKDAINDGISIIILSDEGVNENLVAMPILLAVSAAHHFLVKTSNRPKVSIIAKTAQARDVHQFATLLGFGASAINPYLVYETINELINQGRIKLDLQKAIDNFLNASLGGIVKVASKMGISTLQSYCGAGVFEALGVSNEIIDKYFCGVVSNIEGIKLNDILKDVLHFHNNAFDSAKNNNDSYELSSIGAHDFRSSGIYSRSYVDVIKSKEEEHLYDPLMVYKLQNSCKNKDYNEFKEYCKIVDSKIANIRDCMELDFSHAISIDSVESVESIMQRFKSGAMSYGSISKEAHEAIAIAMNKIGGKSNSGEGGEDETRYKPQNIAGVSVDKNSRIKQVASARFGVNLAYLNSAKEIQIKIAQGAKPGEGGQLPGNKVYPWIAKTRYSTPGVTLISPPPHHDIYSIEDLAQLIFDLKNANEFAKISVKLVSQGGIGTIAAGVAKAGANKILVSGYDGGTGASPKSSLYNVGTPWELGLSEAHQTLILNNLRNRVKLEVDGKLLTGRDLAIAILLGADEFGFATAPLIVLGCTMMRACSLNTCPFGIATQDDVLRARFNGKPEYVINFMRFIAQNLREYMSLLGFKTINDMIGRSDRIKKKQLNGKQNRISLDRILYNPETINNTATHFTGYKALDLSNSLDKSIILPQVEFALRKNRKVNLTLEVSNITGRTLGTLLSSKILRMNLRKDLNGKDCKDKFKKDEKRDLQEDNIVIKTIGNGGNSFGAFLMKGITLEIEGDTNDYLGKGLSGGKIIVKKPLDFSGQARENIIAGNVCLYGALSGEVYLDGVAGERFCVRNSGANAVVLGVGMHGCEYMTGGVVVVLGRIGRNFAAGMSGGYAYIYGLQNVSCINQELVDVKSLDKHDIAELKDMIAKHHNATKSSYSKEILDSFNESEFFKVFPRDYAKMIETIDKYKALSKKSGIVQDDELKAFLEITNATKA